MDESDHESVSRNDPGKSNVVGATRAAVSTAWHACTGWVERRSRLTQLIFGGVIALVLEGTVPVLQQLGSLWLSSISSASVSDAVLALIGTQISQTVVQTHKLDTLRDRLENMSESPTTDGGRSTASWRSGGGILGGVIVGASFGAGYGSRGVIVGAVVGAILGDTFEEWMATPNHRRRDG